MFQAKFHILPLLCSHYIALSRINPHCEIRHQYEFVMALFCTLVRGRCIAVSGPVLWNNSIPIQVGMSISLPSFNRKSSNQMINNYLNHVEDYFYSQTSKELFFPVYLIYF